MCGHDQMGRGAPRLFPLVLYLVLLFLLRLGLCHQFGFVTSCEVLVGDIIEHQLANANRRYKM